MSCAHLRSANAILGIVSDFVLVLTLVACAPDTSEHAASARVQAQQSALEEADSIASSWASHFSSYEALLADLYARFDTVTIADASAGLSEEWECCYTGTDSGGGKQLLQAALSEVLVESVDGNKQPARSWFGTTLHPAADIGDLTPLLAHPLELNGVAIQEYVDAGLGDQISFVGCRNGSPIISEVPQASARMSPVAWLFFRYHEFAHLQLAHIRCGANTEIDSRPRPLLELEADCAAANLLSERFGQVGRNVEFVAAGKFLGTDRRRHGNYPTDRERYNQLTSGKCG